MHDFTEWYGPAVIIIQNLQAFQLIVFARYLLVMDQCCVNARGHKTSSKLVQQLAFGRRKVGQAGS